MTFVRTMLITVAVIVMAISTYGENKGKVGPWNLDELYKTPEWRKTDLAASPGMTSILYQSLPYKGKPVEVFAYYSTPEGKVPEGGWPAVVCIHGGGGTAFDYWVGEWNKHGYAAIAMDLEGHLPLRIPGTSKQERKRQPTPNPGPRRAGVFRDFKKPLNQQWYYHGVAQIILANSLIRSFPEINPEKIGVTGVSWGGMFTSTVMGIDDRFKFAIPGYGCGFLSDSDGNMGRAIKLGKNKAFVNKYYDGSAYFENVKIPTFWVNGTNDFHFPMPSTQKSARAVNGPVTMGFQLKMRHGHGPVIKTKECYAFADSVVKGSQPLLKLSSPSAKDGKAEVKLLSGNLSAKDANLLYTTDDESIWPDKEWKSIPAKIAGKTVTATPPPGTFAFLFTVTDNRGYTVSSEYLEHSVPNEKKQTTLKAM